MSSRFYWPLFYALFHFVLLQTAFAEDEPAGATSEPKEEQGFSADALVSLLSDYMFRGQNLYDGFAAQPSSTLYYDSEFGFLSANLWMHLPLQGTRQGQRYTELDATLAYGYDIQALSFQVGLSWYTYPDSSDEISDTAEYFLSLILDDSELLPFALNPTLTYYKDFREFDYNYFELGFSHRLEWESLGPEFNLTPSLSFGFVAQGEKVYEQDGLVAINLGLSHETILGDFSLKPSVNYSFKIDEQTVNEFWCALNLVYTF